uniref:Macaca fascicularis brain cDNA, clone: QflA-22259 n=1 Tax=Macaca fascicularis TaxID=9541 RepID=I7GMI0_MACFA|nr:unnamed protein product [Macaca fascicularis]
MSSLEIQNYSPCIIFFDQTQIFPLSTASILFSTYHGPHVPNIH